MEEKQYPRVIIVDFDQSIAYSDYPNIIDEVPYAIETLKMLQAQGDIIILCTCREGQFLENALQWMKDRGFTPDCVNDNYPDGRHYHYGNCRKISGDIVIDDKNDNYTVDWLDIRRRLVKDNKNSILLDINNCPRGWYKCIVDNRNILLYCYNNVFYDVSTYNNPVKINDNEITILEIISGKDIEIIDVDGKPRYANDMIE